MRVRFTPTPSGIQYDRLVDSGGENLKVVIEAIGFAPGKVLLPSNIAFVDERCVPL